VVLAGAFIDATRQMPSRGAWNVLTWMMVVVVAGFVAFPIEHRNTTSLAYEASIFVLLEILLVVGSAPRGRILRSTRVRAPREPRDRAIRGPLRWDRF
jgi:hypothetical protein